MTENFLNLVKEIDIQVQEAQKIPNKMNPKRHTPRYIIINMPKVKDRENLKSSKRKAVSYLQGLPVRLYTNFSKETLQARRDQQEIFKVVKVRAYNQDYPTQESHHLKLKDRKKELSRQEELKEYITTKPPLYELLKGLL